MQTVKQQKAALRKHYTEIRRSWNDEQRTGLNRAVTDNAKRLIEELGIKKLFCYVSAFPVELDTIKLIEYALSRGIETAVPKCLDKKGHMSFYSISSISQLEEGCFGIPEPDLSVCREAAADSSALCIVPGLSFDESGKRLGFGGGYYDRFLADFPGLTAGLCTEDCISQKMPADNYDIAVSYILTETRRMCISRKNDPAAAQ